MKIRTKNKHLARQRKRNVLAQTLRRELLSPLNVTGKLRQLAVDPAHPQPAGPPGPVRRRPKRSPGVRSQRSLLDRPLARSTESGDSLRSPPTGRRTTAGASLTERTGAGLTSGSPGPRTARPRGSIVAYGAAAIADGTRIVYLEANISIAEVHEGDRFAVDALGQSALFAVISVGLHFHCIEIDRPLPRGRYGWSIEKDYAPPSALAG